MRAPLFALGVACAACTSRRELPPLPEALVIVDTNLPAPLVAGRLRVDLYAEDGTWFDSTDFGRPDARDWPASFSVYAEDESRERLVWIRLRAYPEGRASDYRGERFRDWDAPFASPPGDGKPRLVRDGVDVTPAAEPDPLVTVDRLVLVRLRPGERGSVRVLLHGACIGTMARMGPPGTASTCVDEEKTRAPVVETALAEDLSLPTTTAAGTWLAGDACDRTGGARVCIPGGATLLGSTENADYTPGAMSQLDSRPVRAFGLRRFYIDRDEITVGGLRAAIANGYVGLLPIANEGVLGPRLKTDATPSCTWSLTRRDREDYAVSCVGWDMARALCMFLGGDLPTEAQWEHAATIAGRTVKARYPWGNDVPTCDRAVYGREPLGAPAPCGARGIDPRPPAESDGDVSPLGVRALFGSLHEWTRDGSAEYASACWWASPIVDPSCAIADAPRRVFRGNSWISDAQRLTSRLSPASTTAYAPLGIRCVYPGPQ